MDSPGTTDQQELVQAEKVVGNGLDAVVRAVRSNPAGAGGVARRVMAFWHEQGRAAIVLEATELQVAGRAVLSAEDQEGRWILPAFMAGLRGVRPEEHCTSDDLARLAGELAGLETDLQSIARFRDWLWADGAEGFQVNLKDSFMELIEAVDADVPWKDPEWSVVRDQVAQELGLETLEVASRELDAAALREEFQVPLEWFARNLESPELSRLLPEECARARAGCEDQAAWARAELDVALEQAQLRSAIPAPRMAGRLLARLAARPDAALLQSLLDLRRADDAYSKAVYAALEAGDPGAVLARSLDLADVEAVPPLADFLRCFTAGAGGGFALGILSRIRRAPQETAVACEFIFLFGLNDFVALVDRRRLTPDQALTLVGVISHCKGSIREVGLLLETVSDACAVAVLKQLPERHLESLLPRARRLFERASPELLNDLAPEMLAGNKPVPTRMVAEALFRQGGHGVSVTNRRRVCEALVATGLAGELLVPCIRSRGASPGLRLAALRALEQAPTLLAQAARWRPAELIESKEMREALKNARRRAKGGRHG
jgi:hypothetical protein